MAAEPTEHDARELLARAAATIEVADDAPLTLIGLPEPSRRRWPLLVAVAATVALVAGGGWVVATRVGDGNSDGPATPTAVDPSGLEHERSFGPGRMPSLLGYTQDEAVRLLTDRGVDVRVRPQRDGCDVAGTVVGADVPVGHRIGPATPVTLTVVKPRKVVDCVGEPDWRDVWDLARFARGLGAAPELAERVGLSVVQGGELVAASTTSGDDLAADRWAWTACGTAGCHSVLGAFAAMLSDPASWSYPGTPYLVAEQGTRCLPGGLGGWRLHLWVEVPVDGVFCPSSSLLLDLDDDGRIDRVELRLPGTTQDLTEPQLDDSLRRTGVAQQFVAWARGDGPAPDFADRVRDLTSDSTRPWIDDPARRQSWSCSGCAGDPLATIAGLATRLVPDPGRATCPEGGAVPAEYAESADVVTVGVAEPVTCDVGWALELWVDAEGRIYAVDSVMVPF